MRARGGWTRVLVLLLLVARTQSQLRDEPVYRAVGDEVVLISGPVSDPITIITWRHGQDVTMEWFKGSVESFRQFKAFAFTCWRLLECVNPAIANFRHRQRGDINGTTGALTISGLTPGDSGNYTAEINNKETRTTQLLVLSRVSKPTVSKQWDPDNTYCVFTCESDTTNAEPVTYSWISQEKSWDSIKELRITNEESEIQFHCELSNPVSTEVSETVQNPFSTLKLYLIVLVCAGLSVAAGIGFYFYK
ncbi:hypothetical protein Q5P01_000289 [Channa striata]|uniref:Ig-like domain-containing protein n=1 Tax=Channa striata TaxID=64152 RepID=A0AA88LF81_CHASR|nr:hypothetical protein Q5P01_000289 [Channa striata]